MSEIATGNEWLPTQQQECKAAYRNPPVSILSYRKLKHRTRTLQGLLHQKDTEHRLSLLGHPIFLHHFSEGKAPRGHPAPTAIYQQGTISPWEVHEVQAGGFNQCTL